MITNSFKINECDKCIYIKEIETGYFILCLYVDDTLIMGSAEKIIKSTKNMLNPKFNVKDLGLVDVILRIKITRIFEGLILSQSHYVDKILENFNKDDSGITKILIDVNLYLIKNRRESVSQLEYSRVIGSLMYLMSWTRPYIACVVSRLGKYASNPSAEHWMVIVREYWDTLNILEIMGCIIHGIH